MLRVNPTKQWICTNRRSSRGWHWRSSNGTACSSTPPGLTSSRSCGRATTQSRRSFTIGMRSSPRDGGRCFRNEVEWIMKIGLVGYQGSGKSSIFELLTRTKPEPSKAHSGQVGMATLPDRRFDGLVKLFNPKKVTPAKIELFDTPGLSRDHGESNNQRISVVREANALVHVIGAYAGGDALADARNFEDDLMLADLQVLQNRIER